MMANIVLLLQISIAFGIFNVWLVRGNRPTAYRGGSATTMEEEFLTYGLSKKMMIFIGTLKLFLAGLLIAGIWVPSITPFAASMMGVLMLGAIAMHFKVNDPIRKAIPAISMFLLCSVVAMSTLP